MQKARIYTEAPISATGSGSPTCGNCCPRARSQRRSSASVAHGPEPRDWRPSRRARATPPTRGAHPRAACCCFSTSAGSWSGAPHTVSHVQGNSVAQRGEPDSFWVQLAGRTAPVSLARGAVVRLEVSRGRKRAVGQGALIGAGLGAIAGFVAGGYAASRSRSCGTPGLADVCYVDWYGRAFRGALIGGTIGGAVGAAVGYAVRTDRWEGVPLSRAHPLVPRGAGLALTF